MPLPPDLEGYFLSAAPGSESELHEGSLVEPLLDGESYFRELGLAFAALGTKTVAENQTAGEFIHIAGFEFTSTGVEIPDTTGSMQSLESVLLAKAAKGVDVRVLGWAHYALNPPRRSLLGALNRELGRPLDKIGASSWNAKTARFILRLRRGAVGAGAALNILSHPGGAAHAKIVIVGNDVSMTSFSGGIDLCENRRASAAHPDEDNGWHDIAIKCEGLAAKPCYVLFSDLWGKNLANPPVNFMMDATEIPSMLATATAVKARTPAPTPSLAARHVAQSLRTLPARTSTSVFLPEPPPYFWPAPGVFEVRDAVVRAISTARSYIYLEDQYFWSAEILVALQAALTDPLRPGLRIVLLTGSMQDPADEVNVQTHRDYLIWRHLTVALTAPQRARLKFYARWGEVMPPITGDHVIATVTATPGSVSTDLVVSDVLADKAYAENYFADYGAVFLGGTQRFRITGNPSIADGAPLQFHVSGGTGNARMAVGSTYQLQRTATVFVHAKTMIVDDAWALIGSANFARRGMRTDIEHAFAFTSHDGDIVKEYRKSLWAHHVKADPASIDDLATALAIFFPSLSAPRWRTEAEFPDYIEALSLPPTVASPPDLEGFQNTYDADSTIPDWKPL